MADELKPGARARLRRMTPPEVYQLPPCLHDGQIVTILSFDTGYYTVRDDEGQTFPNVFCLLVEPLA